MRRVLWLSVLLIAFLFSPAFSDPGDTIWTRTYGGVNSDEAFSMLITSDGGYIIAGNSQSYGLGNHDIYVIKTDEFGDTIWTNTYGTSQVDYARSIQQTSDGGYIITGQSYSDVYLVKINAVGDSIWARTYGGNSSDIGYSVEQTTDQGYVIAGFTESFGAGNRDYYIIKTDSQGDTLWTYTYGGTESDEARSIIQTIDGDYIIVGNTESFSFAESDICVLKMNSNGDTLWTNYYGWIGDDAVYSIESTTDGNFIIAGSSNSYGDDDLDFWLLKMSTDGDTLWTRRYEGPVSELAFSVEQTSDGGYIMGGASWGSNPIDFNFYIVKVDTIGNIEWSNIYGGSAYDWAEAIHQTSDGGYIVAGRTASYGAGNYDYYLMKIEGEQTGYLYLPGDANMANGAWPPQVIGGDVTYLVNYFRGSSSNPSCLLGGFYCSADINGDCNVIGGDVTRLVNYFRGSATVEYCADYEPAWPTPAHLPVDPPVGWPNCE